MKKLILLLLIFAGASATVPSLRQRVEPRVVPVWDAGLHALSPILSKVLDPTFRWSATNEARTLARDLHQRELALSPMPTPSQFQTYVQQHNIGGRGGLDPWGTPYYLSLRRDSITVGSAGPDTQRGTEDDILVSVGRR